MRTRAGMTKRSDPVLDRTAEADRKPPRRQRPASRNAGRAERVAGERRSPVAAAASRRTAPSAGCAASLRRAWQFFVSQSFSSLTRRIVFLNVAGLVALVVGILYLSQFRAGLIDARVQSLLVQGEIIAGAIAASATVDTDAITIDPRPAARIAARRKLRPDDEALSGLEFPINPERVAPVLRRLISPTKTRARIYDRDGDAASSTAAISTCRGDVLRFDLPPPNDEQPSVLERAWIAIRTWLGRGDLPLYRELGPDNGKGYPEVAQALDRRRSASMVRVNDRGEVIVSVAVPVQRFRAVRGALLLSTQGGDIDQMVEAERLQIVKLFLHRCRRHGGAVDAARRHHRRPGAAARRRRRARAPPHPLARRDPRLHRAGATRSAHLSGALRDMTNALYSRIEAIESFAADVAHELKNPLTSLRSAVETLPLAKTPESQRAAARGDPARRAAARPADLRHFRRQPPRRRIAAPGDGAGRPRPGCSTPWSSVAERECGATTASRSRSPSRAAARAPSWCRATIRGSAR